MCPASLHAANWRRLCPLKTRSQSEKIVSGIIAHSQSEKILSGIVARSQSEKIVSAENGYKRARSGQVEPLMIRPSILQQLQEEPASRLTSKQPTSKCEDKALHLFGGPAVTALWCDCMRLAGAWENQERLLEGRRKGMCSRCCWLD